MQRATSAQEGIEHISCRQSSVVVGDFINNAVEELSAVTSHVIKPADVKLLRAVPREMTLGISSRCQYCVDI